MVKSRMDVRDVKSGALLGAKLIKVNKYLSTVSEIGILGGQ